MSDSVNGFDLPRTGGVWEAPDGSVWAASVPGPAEDAAAGAALVAGQREDDARSSYFHVRWLGEAD